MPDDTSSNPPKKENDFGKRLAEALRGTWLPIIPIALSMAAGFIALLVYGMKPPGYLWALACLGAGSLMGIIFGIPHSAGKDNGPTKSGFRANANMEQISDWLTKILVGAGLVELKSLPDVIDKASRYIAPSFSTQTPDGTMISIAGAILIYFSIEGFIAGYIFTRVYFTSASPHRRLNATTIYTKPPWCQ